MTVMTEGIDMDERYIQEEPPIAEQAQPRGEIEHPYIIIDDDAESDYIEELRSFDMRMQAEPEACLESLRHFRKGDLNTQEPGNLAAQWEKLTDRHYALFYYFDGDTERAIADNEELNHVRGSDAGYVRRALRLEIYLTRLKAAKMLGRTALS